MAVILSSNNPSAVGTLVQSGVSVTLLAFLNDTLNIMFPFLCVSVILILVDLFFGVPAAKLRGDKVSLSRGLRMTVNKVVEYICWVILAASLAVAFKVDALNWIILALVIGNEMLSIIGNYFFLHGKRIKGLDTLLVKWLGRKIDLDTSDVEIEDLNKKHG